MQSASSPAVPSADGAVGTAVPSATAPSAIGGEEPSFEDISAALKTVGANVAEAARSACFPLLAPPTVIAVSKTKSAACVKRAYDAGHRVFGENYVHEIVEKAPLLPMDVEWHFIGHLQSNKAKELIQAAPNLVCLHTLDSQKLAQILNKEVGKSARAARPLEVLVQINTSGEESKSGLDPVPLEEIAALCQYVIDSCPFLRFKGLMTIGMPDYTSTPENFRCLSSLRTELAERLRMPEGELHLSMGMSADYAQAITMGATMVRVGSTIFGQRAPKAAAGHGAAGATTAAVSSPA